MCTLLGRATAALLARTAGARWRVCMLLDGRDVQPGSGKRCTDVRRVEVRLLLLLTRRGPGGKKREIMLTRDAA